MRRESMRLPHEKRSGRSHEEAHRRPGAGARADARGRGGKAGLGIPGHGEGSAPSPLRCKPRETRAARQHAFDHARQGRRHVRYPQLVPRHVPGDARDRSIRQQGAAGARVRVLHLPTGTGHDESAYMAGLPASYFIRQMADWKSGDRKFGATMVTMAKVITDAEISDAAGYFASLKPRPWIRVVEADAVPKSYIGQGNKRLVHPDGG